MPESTTSASGTQAEPTTPVQPQAGVSTATTAAGTQAEPSGTPGSESISLDEAKKLRAEAASLRKRLAEKEAAEQAAELAKLGETERLQKEHATLQQQYAAAQFELQSTRLLREISKHGPSLNLVDTETAQVLLEARGEIDYDDRGNPTNVAKLLEKLVAEKPHLVATNVRPAGAVPSSGGATNPGRSAATQPVAPPKTDPKDAYKNRRGLANPGLWKRS